MPYKPSDIQALLRAGHITIDAAHSANALGGLDAYYDVKSEYELQTAVIAECKSRGLTIPEYDWVYAIPNGQYRPGERLEPGTAPGYPDLGWDLARGGYHGARIELKYKENGLKPDQKKWHAWLKVQGFYVVTIWDSVAAVLAELEAYRTGGRRRPRGLK